MIDRLSNRLPFPNVLNGLWDKSTVFREHSIRRDKLIFPVENHAGNMRTKPINEAADQPAKSFSNCCTAYLTQDFGWLNVSVQTYFLHLSFSEEKAAACCHIWQLDTHTAPSRTHLTIEAVRFPSPELPKFMKRVCAHESTGANRELCVFKRVTDYGGPSVEYQAHTRHFPVKRRKKGVCAWVVFTLWIVSTECVQAAGVCPLPLWTAAGPCRIGLFMVAKLPLPETAHPSVRENARNRKSCARAPCFQLENGGGPLDANRHKVMTDFLKRASSANIKSPPDYVFFKHFLCPSLRNLCPELSRHEKLPGRGNDSIIETFKITNRGRERGEKATKTIS